MADELVERLEALAETNEYYGFNGRTEVYADAAARIQTDAAEIAALKAELAEAQGKVTALEASLHAHNSGTLGCICISTPICDLARAGDPEPPE